MTNYTPVELAHFVAEPENGVDENLSPIIFLHGIGGFKEMWGEIPQVVADKTKRKAYVLDQRNHGDTEWTDSFNFDMLVDDLLYFMDTRYISKAHIIGHSMGGVVGTRTALRSPDRVESLIVEDMYVKKVPKEVLGMITTLLSMGQQILKQIPSELDETEAIKMYFQELNQFLPESMRKDELPPEMLKTLKGFMKRNEDGQWIVKYNHKVIEQAVKDYETLMSEPEGTYDGPSCFVYGTTSEFSVKAEEEHIRKHFPKAELVPIEGASHNITADCPEELTEAFINFLTKVQES